MKAETDLKTLLSGMRPALDDNQYIICSLSLEIYSKLTFTPLLSFQEHEGVTVIATLQQAVANELPTDLTWAYICLTIHSSLNAVGFIAAISSQLAKAGISLNVVSGYYHDHLFVPWEKRKQAMQVLGKLSVSQGIPPGR